MIGEIDSSRLGDIRLLQIIAGEEWGGAERFFEKLAVEFAKLGVRQKAIIGNFPDRAHILEAAGVDVACLDFPKGVRGIFSKWEINRIASDFAPTTALTWMNRASRRMPSGDFVKVGRLGGYYPVSNYKKCDYLISNTPDIHRFVVESGWPPSRAVMISNFGELAACPDVHRDDFDTPQDRILLLAMGRLHSSKGFDLVLRALVELPQCCLWVAGDGPEKESLERLCAELNLGDRVRFLGWRNDQAALYRAADICVIPSRHEPLSNVVLECWSERTPIVATRSEGPSWLITDEEDGLLVDVDDLKGLTAAIARVVASDSLREKLARRGYEKWHRSFSKDVITKQYLEFILSIQKRHLTVSRESS